MKMKFSHTWFLLILSLMLSTSLCFSQGDVNLQISETSINQAIQVLLDSKAINFSKFDGSFGVSQYNINISSASINLIGNSSNNVELSVGLTGRATFDLVLFSFSVNINSSFKLIGNATLQSQGQGYKLIFNPQSISNFTLTGTFLDGLVQDYVNGFVKQIPEISLVSFTSLLPNIAAQYFTSGTPTLTITDNAAILSLTIAPQIFIATGGTITYSNGNTIHTFTGSGTFSCTQTGNVKVLVVAGGGGGGCHTGGGGGAGGVVYNASYSASGNISVTVGTGGNGSTANNVAGSNGLNSVFGSITALGGGGGASRFTVAGSGGSGGGGSPQNGGNSKGSGTSGQGYAGGVGGNTWNFLSGGGGGAGAVGSGGTGSGGNGNGGVGVANAISGSSIYYAGGGGGGVYSTDMPGAGGTGGGGAGSNTSSDIGNGTPNTGGGGGGGGLVSGTMTSRPGGNGGSGIVIVSYPTPHATGGTITYSNGNTIHTFTGSGTFSCTQTGNVKVLVVAGGGGGGCHTGGGGGAGGVVYNASYSASGNISVTVGTGGNGSTANNVAGSNGLNSVFGSITALGGGGGASRFTVAGNGGSGGGGSPNSSGNSNGSGTSGQGYAGGVGGNTWNFLSGGGGGAGAVGSGGTGSGGNGNGGVGFMCPISGSSVYGGGGGGGVYGTDVPGAGGNGGGGAGSNTSSDVHNGAPNTGGGGGGGGLVTGTMVSRPGGNGGSGIVIVSYPTGGLYKSFQGNTRALAEEPISVPTEYSLSQNYPNPFNPSTVISYQLPGIGTRYSVSLKVYDMLGREVVTLVDGMKEAGYYSATFDASHLASGIYFARVIASPEKGNKPFTKIVKMMLMK